MNIQQLIALSNSIKNLIQKNKNKMSILPASSFDYQSLANENVILYNVLSFLNEQTGPLFGATATADKSKAFQL